MADYDIAVAFERIENELISSMIRNMARHQAEETSEGFEWSMWQAEQLRYLERYKKANKKKYGKQFGQINQNIEMAIREAYAAGGMEQEIEILEAIKKGYKGYHKVSGTVQGAFFRANERKLDALINATTSDMQRAETAILRMANDQYRKIIYNAQVYANTGAGTYAKAVDMATHDMLSAGLNCVEYKNGARHTLKDYADMAIRTASKRAYLSGEGAKRHEWGISTVIVNKRGNPCPKCLPFCGKVMIDDVWSGGKASDGPYPLISTAVAAGLYHPRCKDSHTTYFPGISTADDKWTKKELASIEQSNKQEAQDQYAERQKEKFERLTAYSLDKENKEKYKAKQAQWSKASAFITNVKNYYKQNPNVPIKDFGKEVLKEFGIANIPVNIIPMDAWGYCRIKLNDGIMNIIDYNLNADDTRPWGYRIKTAFHEAYHARGNGRKTDYWSMPHKNWLDIEETFAESSAHYMAGEMGIKDLAPSYSERIVDILPRLKKLPEYSRCSTIADFGKIAFENRINGVASEWESLYNRVEKVEHDWKGYSKQYIPYISNDVDGYVEKMLENMPQYKQYKSSMTADAAAAIQKVKNGDALNMNEEIVWSRLISIAMNRLGVK